MHTTLFLIQSFFIFLLVWDNYSRMMKVYGFAHNFLLPIFFLELIGKTLHFIKTSLYN